MFIRRGRTVDYKALSERDDAKDDLHRKSRSSSEKSSKKTNKGDSTLESPVKSSPSKRIRKIAKDVTLVELTYSSPRKSKKNEVATPPGSPKKSKSRHKPTSPSSPKKPKSSPSLSPQKSKSSGRPNKSESPDTPSSPISSPKKGLKSVLYVSPARTPSKKKKKVNLLGNQLSSSLPVHDEGTAKKKKVTFSIDLASTEEGLKAAEKRKKKERKAKKKQKKAAIKIQALARGFYVRGFLMRPYILQKRLEHLNHSKDKIIEKIQRDLAKKKEEYRRKRQAKHLKKVNSQKEIINSLEDNQQQIEHLRKENAKIRSRNDILNTNCQNLRINNTRLEETNESSAECYNRLKVHHDRCAADNKKLVDLDTKYKTKLDDLQQQVDKKTAQAKAEYRIKKSNEKSIQKCLDMVRKTKNESLIGCLEEMIEVLEAHKKIWVPSSFDPPKPKPKPRPSRYDANNSSFSSLGADSPNKSASKPLRNDTISSPRSPRASSRTKITSRGKDADDKSRKSSSTTGDQRTKRVATIKKVEVPKNKPSSPAIHVTERATGYYSSDSDGDSDSDDSSL